MDADRLPPNSPELEQAVLGTLLEQPRKAVAEFLSMAPNVGRYFYDSRHQAIFPVLAGMVDAGRRVTADSLLHALKERKQAEDAGGVAYLAEVLNHATSIENLKDHCDELRKLYVKRCLVEASVRISDAGYDQSADEALALAEQSLLNIRNESNPAQEADIKTLVQDTLNHFEEALTNRGKLRGIATGFYDLDRRLRGMRPGQLIILAARPGGGKTSFALNIVERVACDDRIPVGVFSLEMTSEELTQRLIASRSRVSIEDLERGEFTEGDQPRITEAASRIAASPIHICDEGGITISQLRSKARRMAMRHGIQLLVVDYLQLLGRTGRKGATTNDEVGDMSRGLKSLAKELRLPVIALSQLNRSLERDGDRKPRLSDLRDSGSIEQDADVVAFLHPEGDEEANPMPVSLLIRKHRNGSSGSVPLTFRKNWTRFESASLADEP